MKTQREGSMILREWRGRSRKGNAAAYPQHFRSHVIPGLNGIPGFLGGYLLSRETDGFVEFTVMTKWASMQSVRTFAGSDPTKAVVERGAIAGLGDYDAHVVHHEMLVTVEGTP